MDEQDLPVPRIFYKGTRESRIATAIFAVFTMMVAGLVAYQSTRSSNPQTTAKVDAWNNTNLHDVEKIELRPIDGGDNAKTLALPLIVTNKETLRAIWKGLHSGNVELQQHRGGNRYAKLEVFTQTGTSTPFYISWDDPRGVCEFSIMPRPKMNDFRPNGIRERASTELGDVLDVLVASNRIEWAVYNAQYHTK